MFSPFDIVDYAAAHGFTFEAACAAIDLYRDDPEYYHANGLAILMRHASPEAAVKPDAYTVRV